VKAKSTRLVRPNLLCGPGGRLEVGRTTFFDNYVKHPGGEEFIPGTNIPRLRLIKIGKRAVAAFEDEVDDLLMALRAERDAQSE
jgi:hypothetical protein